MTQLRIFFAFAVFVIGTYSTSCDPKDQPIGDICTESIDCDPGECSASDMVECRVPEGQLIGECTCVPIGNGGSGGTGGSTGTGGTGGGANADPDAQDIIEFVVDAPIDFFQLLESSPTGVATANSNPNIQPSIPVASADAAFIGVFIAFLNVDMLARLANLDGLFLDGAVFSVAGPSTRSKALSLDPEVPANLEEGLYLFVWQTMLAPIPQSDPTQLLQYAFVVDRDRQVVNNYRGQAPFEDDYFDATDLWFSLEYNPQDGWRFEVTDALNGNLMPRASAAVGIISGETNMFIIPVSEFDGSSTIAARWTAFAHEGDFGQEGGPWSGDTTPPVGALLEQISLTAAP